MIVSVEYATDLPVRLVERWFRDTWLGRKVREQPSHPLVDVIRQIWNLFLKVKSIMMSGFLMYGIFRAFKVEHQNAVQSSVHGIVCVLLVSRNHSIYQFITPWEKGVENFIEEKKYVNDDTNEATALRERWRVRRDILLGIRRNTVKWHLIHGEPGTGKRALLETVADDLLDAGYEVFRANSRFFSGPEQFEYVAHLMSACVRWDHKPPPVLLFDCIECYGDVTKLRRSVGEKFEFIMVATTGKDLNGNNKFADLPADYETYKLEGWDRPSMELIGRFLTHGRGLSSEALMAVSQSPPRERIRRLVRAASTEEVDSNRSDL